jgi:hypothetical protein
LIILATFAVGGEEVVDSQMVFHPFWHSGSNGTENSLKESGKLLDRFRGAAEGA